MYSKYLDLTADAREVEGKTNAANFVTNNTMPRLAELFSKVDNSVVQVTATANVKETCAVSSLGSEFVYDKNRNVITNYHESAPAANADGIIVTLWDESVFNAKLVYLPLITNY